MLDEASFISTQPCVSSQGILQRGEGADPSGQLDERTPQGGRQVHIHHPPPAQGQQTAKNDEQNKEEVDEDDEVSEHGRSGGRAVRRSGGQAVSRITKRLERRIAAISTDRPPDRLTACPTARPPPSCGL